MTSHPTFNPPLFYCEHNHAVRCSPGNWCISSEKREFRRKKKDSNVTGSPYYLRVPSSTSKHVSRYSVNLLSVLATGLNSAPYIVLETWWTHEVCGLIDTSCPVRMMNWCTVIDVGYMSNLGSVNICIRCKITRWQVQKHFL